MLISILKQINWVDIFIVIILLRITYIAVSRGFILELFKITGLVFATYISLHYYTLLSDYLDKFIPFFKSICPLEFFDFICFIFLLILGYSLSLALRFVFSHFIKMEAVALLNKWGGFILGLLRGVLFSGLIMYILIISSIDYLKNSAVNAYSSKYLIKVAPKTYYFLWDKLMSKLMPKEKANPTVDEVISSL